MCAPSTDPRLSRFIAIRWAGTSRIQRNTNAFWDAGSATTAIGPGEGRVCIRCARPFQVSIGPSSLRDPPFPSFRRTRPVAMVMGARSRPVERCCPIMMRDSDITTHPAVLGAQRTTVMMRAPKGGRWIK